MRKKNNDPQKNEDDIKSKEQWMYHDGKYYVLSEMARNSGENPLHNAARKGNLFAMKILLSRYKSQVNETANGGITPLFVACRHGHVKVVELLLKMDEIDVNRASSRGGDSQEKYLLKNLLKWNFNSETCSNYSISPSFYSVAHPVVN